ncbi:MAG TPA: aldo/keto reductase [Phycisphaerae bacterium]|nr:aldo/keto reductase [Phycisphaerae bacterium]
MQYARLGNSGLHVSRLCLGCMSYGVPARGTHPWSLDLEASRPFIRRALELGITFFDTANVYSDGTSEQFLGTLLKEVADTYPRESLVIATKVHGRMRPDPNGRGLSRKAILQEMDASLRRLGMDYVDLYQIHRLDDQTPIEETLEALHDVVKAGKARYIGASSMFAWQFAKALFVADRLRLTRFVSMQNHYNLLYREEEREMNPLCRDQGVAIIPWSPLARGRLTRPWNTPTGRTASDAFGGKLYGQTQDADRAVVERLGEVAQQTQRPRAQVALAWLLAQPGVTAPIIGATKTHHLEDAVAALEMRLSPEQVAALQEPYAPHPVLGIS